MEVLKRKANGISSTNGHEQKKKKKERKNEEQDLETTYFESEITYHSTVTKMKVGYNYKIVHDYFLWFIETWNFLS